VHLIQWGTALVSTRTPAATHNPGSTRQTDPAEIQGSDHTPKPLTPFQYTEDLRVRHSLCVAVVNLRQLPNRVPHRHGAQGRASWQSSVDGTVGQITSPGRQHVSPVHMS
jgi:hypothetical protein